MVDQLIKEGGCCAVYYAERSLLLPIAQRRGGGPSNADSMVEGFGADPSTMQSSLHGPPPHELRSQGGAMLAPKQSEAVRRDCRGLARSALARNAHGRGVIAVILHDEGAVVIGEQRDMIRRVDPHWCIGEQIILDPGDQRLRQRVQIAEILRHGPQVQSALGI